MSDAAERKAQIVARMQAQREAWQAARAPQAETQPGPEPADDEGAETEGPPRSGLFAALSDNQVVRVVAQHPLAAAGLVGVLLMLGPRRLLRLSAWVLPLVMRR